MRKVCRLILTLAVVGLPAISLAQRGDDGTVGRMFRYGASHVVRDDTLRSNVYSKSTIHIVRQNATLAAVPTMFYLLRGGRRRYFSESYSSVLFPSAGEPEVERNVHLSTVYHRHSALPLLETYLVPHLYGEQIYKEGILSPANGHNRRYYRYETFQNRDGTATVAFRSRYRNTQLLRRGHFVVDSASGQILSYVQEGEFNMIHFTTQGTMSRDTGRTAMPERCEIRAKLSFLGNRVRAHYSAFYDQPGELPAQVVRSRDRALMDSLRPVVPTPDEQRIIDEFDSINGARHTADSLRREGIRTDSTRRHRRNWAKYIFWDIIGDNMLNRIKADLGDEDQGQLKIGPIFNPLYFGYSKHKGVVYKFDLRGYYNFSATNSLNSRIRAGYSFKQKLLYYTIPLTWNFHKPRNGFVTFEFGNGNRISNSKVLENIKTTEHVDSINWDAMGLDYFKDMRFHLGVNYDVVARRLGVQTGFTINRRSAVDKEGFKAAGRPTVYKTFAPFLLLSYRPLSDRVPFVVTSEWGHGCKAFGGDIAYDRFEFDAQYVYRLPRMRSLQMRAGMGFYTHKGHDDYFLDYENFHEDYIPSGWGDKWTGDFELLNSNWYNASDYYVRGNATYESPLLALAYCPLIGRIVEKERIYASILAVRRVFPYVEAGYAFVTRVASLGVFTGFSRMGFEGVGFKFGFELFNNY